MIAPKLKTMELFQIYLIFKNKISIITHFLAFFLFFSSKFSPVYKYLFMPVYYSYWSNKTVVFAPGWIPSVSLLIFSGCTVVVLNHLISLFPPPSLPSASKANPSSYPPTLHSYSPFISQSVITTHPHPPPPLPSPPPHPLTPPPADPVSEAVSTQTPPFIHC